MKWGGDAVLLLFDGPDHARARPLRRVPDAGHAAHGRPADRQSPGTPGCGCRSGSTAATFHFFLVGDPALHRELLVCGPARHRGGGSRRRRARVRSALSPATAALLAPDLLGRRRWATGRLLRR